MLPNRGKPSPYGRLDHTRSTDSITDKPPKLPAKPSTKSIPSLPRAKPPSSSSKSPIPSHPVVPSTARPPSNVNERSSRTRTEGRPAKSTTSSFSFGGGVSSHKPKVGIPKTASYKTAPSRTPPKTTTPPQAAHRSSPGIVSSDQQSLPKNTFALLCGECRSIALANSRGAFCFIGNNGRPSAINTRSNSGLYGHHCKSLHCPNNEQKALIAASQPKKYLVSKRHLLKPQASLPIKSKNSSKKSKADLVGTVDDHFFSQGEGEGGRGDEFDMEEFHHEGKLPSNTVYKEKDELIKGEDGNFSRSPSQQSGFLGGIEYEASLSDDGSQSIFEGSILTDQLDAYDMQNTQEYGDTTTIASSTTADAEYGRVEGLESDDGQSYIEDDRIGSVLEPYSLDTRINEEEDNESLNQDSQGIEEQQQVHITQDGDEKCDDESDNNISELHLDESQVTEKEMKGSKNEEQLQPQQDEEEKGDIEDASQQSNTFSNDNEASQIIEETGEKAEYETTVSTTRPPTPKIEYNPPSPDSPPCSTSTTTATPTPSTESTTTEPAQEKKLRENIVALRRQMFQQEKKPAAPNAIEEVVQKLAPRGKKKSVRVLVEAFESIITTQDSSPTAHANV